MKTKCIVILAVVLNILMANSIFSWASDVKININTNRYEEWKELLGIKKKLAKEIVNGRPYKSEDEFLNKLLAIEIPQETRDEIRDRIIFLKIDLNSKDKDQLVRALMDLGVKKPYAEAIANNEQPYKEPTDVLKIDKFVKKELQDKDTKAMSALIDKMIKGGVLVTEED